DPEKGPSPRQVDYVLREVFGGLGRTALAVSDSILDTYGSTQGPAGIEYAPVVGGLLYGRLEKGARAVDRFYKDYQRAQVLEASARAWANRGLNPSGPISAKDIQLIRALPAMRAIANELSALRKDANAPEVRALPPERRRQ